MPFIPTAVLTNNRNDRALLSGYDNPIARLVKTNHKASHADPSTMLAMVEAGAIPGLLKHLASSTEEPLSSQQRKLPNQEAFGAKGSGGIFGRHDRTDGGLHQAEADQPSPSLVLAVRLLYAFSLDPGVRCVEQLSACCG